MNASIHYLGINADSSRQLYAEDTRLEVNNRTDYGTERQAIMEQQNKEILTAAHYDIQRILKKRSKYCSNPATSLLVKMRYGKSHSKYLKMLHHPLLMNQADQRYHYLFN